MEEMDDMTNTANITYTQDELNALEEHNFAPANNETYRGEVSVVLGICSFFFGWLLVAPIIGLWFGLRSRKLEPQARKVSTWGIALNAVLLSLWALLFVLLALVIGMGIFTQ